MCQPNSGIPACVSDPGLWVPKEPKGLSHPHWGVPATEMGKEVEKPCWQILEQMLTVLEQTGADWEWGLSPLYLELCTTTAPHDPLLRDTLLNLLIFGQTCPLLLSSAHMDWSAAEKHRIHTAQYTAVRQSCAADTSKGLPSNKLGVNSCFFPSV